MKITILSSLLLLSSAFAAFAQQFMINSIPANISRPGYYTVTANLSSNNIAAFIQVNASNVTIDLNEHTLSTSTATLDCIYVNRQHNVRIIDGTIQNNLLPSQGAGNGIDFETCQQCQVVNLQITASEAILDAEGSLNQFKSNLLNGNVLLSDCGGDLFEDNLVTGSVQAEGSRDSGSAFRNNTIFSKSFNAAPMQLETQDVYQGNLFPGLSTGAVSGGSHAQP
jgi:hypothetical protein